MAVSTPAAGSVQAPDSGEGRAIQPCAPPPWLGAVAQALALRTVPTGVRQQQATALLPQAQACQQQPRYSPFPALLGEVPQHSPRLHSATPGKHVQPRPLALASQAPSGCGHGNTQDQSPLLSQSLNNRCELQHCSLCTPKGSGPLQAGASRLWSPSRAGGRHGQRPCSTGMCLAAGTAQLLPPQPALCSEPAPALGPLLREAITLLAGLLLGRQAKRPLSGSRPAAMPTASTR